MTAAAAPKRAAIIFIFITVVLDMLALGIVIPVLPTLIEGFVANDTARTAQILGLFATVWALMHFVFSPIFGALSDRYGRRSVILLSNFGLAADYVLMALAPTLGLLFVGRVISGITASNISAAGAYIADVTPPEKRAAGFGILGAAFGIGFVAGPALGGILGHYDPRLPFWVSAGLCLLNAVYGIFVLPESLPPERRSAFLWSKANPVGALHFLRHKPRMMPLAIVHFLSYIAHAVLPAIFVLYAAYRYGWKSREVGFALASVGICAGVAQSVLVAPFVKRLGEMKTLYAGLAFGILGFVAYAVADRPWIFMVLAVPLSCLWGVAGPALQGIMTQQVEPSEQGQLQGALSSLRGLSELIGPGLFTFTFATFISLPTPQPGAPFWLAALILGASLVLALRIR
jgi:DHA1 family tetracycline resistance protein-like MFS transporter